MMKITRRQMIAQSATVAGLSALSLPGASSATAAAASPDQLRFCLNTSTIRGQKIPLPREIELVAKHGYSGIEPWINEIRSVRESGVQLSAVKQQLDDLGVRVESAIGFANWIADDDAQRRKGLEDLKRDMEMVRQIGGTRIAAPPAGGTKQSLNLDRVAERYAAALEIGQSMGVIPLIELWGFSATLHRLGELMYVAVESGSPDAALLLSVLSIPAFWSFKSLVYINTGCIQGMTT